MLQKQAQGKLGSLGGPSNTRASAIVQSFIHWRRMSNPERLWQTVPSVYRSVVNHISSKKGKVNLMCKSLLCVVTFFLVVPYGLTQTSVPMAGSCAVTYNADGSNTLVCTTSSVVPAAPVSVTVSPASANLTSGSQLQFTATVVGTANHSVVWSTSAGSITNAGLLSAPSSAGTLTVTATSVSNPGISGSTTVAVTSSGGGGGSNSAPTFTGNYCTGPSTCTLNNVAAGDLLIIGTHQAFPPVSLLGPQTITDSHGETAVFDAMNLGAGLQTWHISPVITPGAHTVTATNFGPGDMYVAEFAGVAIGNPIEVIAQNFYASSSTDTITFTTQTPNDLLFAFGRSAPGGSLQGPGFTAIRTAPTMEYEAVANSGSQTAAIQPLNNPGNNVGIEALAIRPANSYPPPPASPTFTGNFCVQNLNYGSGPCTLNNVAAGNMLVISALWHGTPSDTCLVSDSTGESIVVDRQNDIGATVYGNLSLGTWHISNLAHGGTHVISTNGGGGNCWSQFIIEAFEFSNQNAANPIDAVGYASGPSTSTASTNVVTTQGNDLIYAFCVVTDLSTSQTGDGFGSITVFPTAQYRMAASTPGTEAAGCPTTGGWVIQELAIRH